MFVAFGLNTLIPHYTTYNVKCKESTFPCFSLCWRNSFRVRTLHNKGVLALALGDQQKWWTDGMRKQRRTCCWKTNYFFTLQETSSDHLGRTLKGKWGHFSSFALKSSVRTCMCEKCPVETRTRNKHETYIVSKTQNNDLTQAPLFIRGAW